MLLQSELPKNASSKEHEVIVRDFLFTNDCTIMTADEVTYKRSLIALPMLQDLLVS